MEQLTATINASKVRRATLNNKEYLVAPLSLIVTGVLNGSKGSLFYPADEISKDPTRWNHTPIVVNHPVDNGINISARNPDVLDKSGIGIVMKSHYANNKLRAEGWFDVEACRRISPYIYNNLVAGKPLELSTGLFTTNEPAQQGANYKGRYYDYVARDYVPDHLAILPDQVGACSLIDGCGVNVNSLTENGGPGSGPQPGGGKKDKGFSSGTLKSLPKTQDEAESLAWATRDTLIGEDDEDVAEEGDCNRVAYAMKDLHPDIEIYQGNYDGGEGHDIVKAGDFFIDVTADQFGGPAVKVWSTASQEAGNQKAYWGFQRSKGEESIADSLDPGRSKNIAEHLKDFDDSANMVSNFNSETKSLLRRIAEYLGIVSNGGPGSGPQPGGGSKKHPTEKLGGNLERETHADKPKISGASLTSAFQAEGFVAKAEDSGASVVIAKPATVAAKMVDKGWSHDSYQIKDGVRTDLLSKGSNRLTLTEEGAGKTAAFATKDHPVTANRKWSQKKRDNAPSKDFAGPDESFPITTQADVDAAAKLVGHAKDPEAVKARIISIAKAKNLSIPKSWQSTTNEELVKGGVKETQDDHVGTSITLEEKEVPNMAKLSDDERKTIVNELVKNCSCLEANAFDESDRTTLMTFNDAKLTTLKNQREKLVQQEAVVNAVKQGFGDISVNEMPAVLLAAKKEKGKGKKVVEENAEEDTEGEEEMPVKNQSRLSVEEKEDLAFARQIKTERKNQAIVKITANTRNKFSKDQLNGMTLDVLTNMAELAAPEETQEASQQRYARRPMYLGASAPVSNQQELTANAEQDKADVESMIPPVINYAELSKEHRQSDKGSQRQLTTYTN